MTPKNADKTGAASSVNGVLLIANTGVLEQIVVNGPRALKIKNMGGEAVAVDVLACLGIA